MTKDSGEYSEAETDKRREAGLKKLLATPPKPHKPLKATESKRPKSKPK